MKAHVGSISTATVHSSDTTTANVHESQVWDELRNGEETSVWADKGDISAERQATFTDQAKLWDVMRRALKDSPLHPVDAQINRMIAMVRARVQHPFRVLKCQFGYVMTHSRGLSKNRDRLFTLFALGNLFLVRRRLLE